MAKNRMVRPEMWTDDKFVGLTPLARLLFIGMWNFACDNGHLDDSALQLKMRVLPADDCDLLGLLDELLAVGMVVRKDSYLKVVNLSDKQPLDLRFLVFCDHCDDDAERRYNPEDKKPSRGQHAGSTRATPERTTGARRSGVGVGGVDGDGAGGSTGAKRPHQLPDDFEPNDANRRIADERGLHLDSVVAQFADHHRAKGTTMKDWHLALNTWLRRERPDPRTTPAKPRRHASELELPPDGLTPDEYAAWELAQRQKRNSA